MSDAVYARVRDEFIKSLEKGVAPWHKPWTPAVPMSLYSKKVYRGVNFFALAMLGYRSVWWVTMTEVKKNGRVKEGCEKDYFPVLAPIMKKMEGADGSEFMHIVGVKYINVYNKECVEGIEFPEENFLDFQPISVLDAIFAAVPGNPNVVHRTEGECYYSPYSDKVVMQHRERFVDEKSYYRTRAHELIHWTGHPDRCNRTAIAEQVKNPLFTTFDIAAYSFEELVAEIGATMLMARAGVQTGVESNSVAYVAHWLQYLKSSPPKLITQAAKAAQDAVDYLFGDKVKENEIAYSEAG